MSPPRASQAPRPGRPAFEVADIFRAHGEAYRQVHPLSGDQRKAMRDLEACRTAVLGGHLEVCPACGHEHPAYNSCCNRHCPKCQSLAQARWVEARLERLLPTHYFHVVFTLPSSLRPLVWHNRVLLFDLLFASAARTLLELGQDPQRLGGQLGVTAVLHTWTRELTFHPHVHCIVTGGGLAPSLDRWVSASRKHLFPVDVLGALFRGKFLDGLRRAYAAGELALSGSCASLANAAVFAQFVDALYRTDWVTYAKRPFAGPEQVFRYLGRYTHRVGISNQRLQAVDDHGVRFLTKGQRSVTLPPQEFIRRFLLHILPAGFVKIRHFGLLAAGNVRKRLPLAFALLGGAVPIPPPAPRSWKEILRSFTGVDPSSCPRCGGPLVRRILPRRSAPFAPLLSPHPAGVDTS